MNRATFSSLIARHEAYRLATDILHDRPIDATGIECTGCGTHLWAGWADWWGRVPCPTCGRFSQFPPYVVELIRAERPDLAPARDEPREIEPWRAELIARCQAESEPRPGRPGRIACAMDQIRLTRDLRLAVAVVVAGAAARIRRTDDGAFAVVVIAVALMAAVALMLWVLGG